MPAPCAIRPRFPLRTESPGRGEMGTRAGDEPSRDSRELGIAAAAGTVASGPFRPRPCRAGFVPEREVPSGTKGGVNPLWGCAARDRIARKERIY